MKRKHQAKPGSIKSTALTGLSIICILIGLCLAELAKAAPIVLQQDNRQPNTQCANGLWGLDGCLPGYEYVAPGLIFSENFDDQPDWVTTGRQSLPAQLPLNWDFARTDEEWHPADGDVGTQPSMMINGNNPDQVYGGTGKAFITYSESFNATDDNGFTSDGFIGKDITPTDEIYVKFNIKFQPGWASDSEGGQIKVFRVLSWDGPDSGTGERNKFFSTGNSGPIYIWDWAQNSYGARHFHAFRCDDQQTNYYCVDPTILGSPRQVVTGDMNTNYTSELTGTNPQIPDQINGGFITRNLEPKMYHNNVWLSGWNTLEFHLKLNSAPGIRDGILRFWQNGELIVDMDQIAWIGVNGSMDAKWNSISFGGNDAFHFDLVGAPADRERWYAIDNIEVWNMLPEELQ